MSLSPRRHHLRCEEDISGQFRVTVPAAGELDQLRTGGGYIGGDCIPLGIGIMHPLSESSPYTDPPVNLPQSQWIQMMLNMLLKKLTGE